MSDLLWFWALCFMALRAALGTYRLGVHGALAWDGVL